MEESVFVDLFGPVSVANEDDFDMLVAPGQNT
jgi:hypothetical protein